MSENSEGKYRAGLLTHGRQNMCIVNIMINDQIGQALKMIDEENRSAAVRYAVETVISAYRNNQTWVIGEIKKRVDASDPANRRADQKNGKPWRKAVVWVPDQMMREIERISAPNSMRSSEFIRGCAIFSTENKIEG